MTLLEPAPRLDEENDFRSGWAVVRDADGSLLEMHQVRRVAERAADWWREYRRVECHVEQV